MNNSIKIRTHECQQIPGYRLLKLSERMCEEVEKPEGQMFDHTKEWGPRREKVS